jgi:hypothetical protein
MPIYRVTDKSTGKVYNIKGDSPPTEADLTEVLGQQKTDWGGVGKSILSDIAKPFQKGAQTAELMGRGIDQGIGNLLFGDKYVNPMYKQGAYDSLPDLVKPLAYSPDEVQNTYGGENTAERYGKSIMDTTKTSAGIGSWFIPGKGLISGGKAVSSIAPQIAGKIVPKGLETLLNVGVHGATSGALQEFSKPDATIGSVTKGAATSAALPMAFEGIGQGISKVGKFLKGNEMIGAPAFIQSGLDQPVKALENEARTGDYLDKQVLTRGVAGSEKQVTKQAQQEMTKSFNNIEKYSAASTEKKIDLLSIVDDILPKEMKSSLKAGNAEEAGALGKWAQTFMEHNGKGGDLTLAEALDTRRALDEAVKKTFGKELGKIDSSQVFVQRYVGDRLRDEIRKKFPEVASDLDNYHFWSRLEDSMILKQALNRSKGAIPSSMWSALTYIVRPVRTFGTMSRVGGVINKVGTKMEKTGTSNALLYGAGKPDIRNLVTNFINGEQ